MTDEAEALCDRVAILRGGRLLGVDTLAYFRKATGTQTVRIRLAAPPGCDTATVRRGLPSVLAVHIVEPVEIEVRTPHDDTALPRLLARLTAAGAVVEAIDNRRSTFEDVYLAWTARGVREDGGSAAGTGA